MIIYGITLNAIECLRLDAYCGVLIGQKRLPMPPAIITKCFAIMFLDFFTIIGSDKKEEGKFSKD